MAVLCWMWYCWSGVKAWVEGSWWSLRCCRHCGLTVPGSMLVFEGIVLIVRLFYLSSAFLCLTRAFFDVLCLA